MLYLDYYLLSFFDAKKATSNAQLLHVFQGKRTPSMFYITEINNWHHAFAQFKFVSVEEIEKIIQQLLHKKWLAKEGKGYVITQTGLDAREEYFSTHYFPKVDRFANLNIRKSFWDRLQLFVQSFSEMSHHNKQYSPVIKHPQHQENVRLLFQQFATQRDQLLNMWIAEQEFIFNRLDASRADVLAAQLTGNQKIGETKSQIQGQLEMESLEYSFYHQDTIEDVLNVVQNHPNELVILSAIIHQLHIETNHGLSTSTHISYELLKNGLDISRIANRRQLKENTIREHILEMAFILPNFSIAHFIPKDVYAKLNNAFDRNEKYTYKDAREELLELEFMHYRLVELERMRMNG